MQYYFDFYSAYLRSAWDHITPMQYGYVLVTIAVVGWLAMRSNLK